jgi:hypothetical protein
VGHVAREEPVEVAPPEDQRPVQYLASHGPYPALGEGIRLGRTNGREHDSGTLGLEDGVEGTGELRVAVPDEQADATRVIRHPQVASLLSDELSALGWQVAWVMWIRRVPTSMKNST